jgi:hemerythrin superfamily protein
MEKELRELTLNELEDLKCKLENLHPKIDAFEEDKNLLGAELDTLQIKSGTLKIKTIQSLIRKVQIMDEGTEILAIFERAIQFKAEENRQKLLQALEQINQIDPLKPL